MTNTLTRWVPASVLSALVAAVMNTAAWGQSAHPFGRPVEGTENPAATLTAAPGSRAQGWLAQGRSEIIARHGMVATSDPLATQAGLEILRQGGNAIDAAVAASVVLDVTSPNDTGLAGDLFALVWSAKDQKLFALNSAGFAPAAWTPAFFTEDLGLLAIPSHGVNAATVPGAVSGYHALLARFGNLGFEETFERAARLAEEGWGLTERRHADLVSQQEKLLQDRDSAEVFLPNGKVPPLYSLITNPGLARALRLLQREGREAFYNGAIADALVAKIQAAGGMMTHEDLAAFESEWVEPVSTSYHGYDVFQLPPPGQGWAALEMLNILEVCAPQHGVNLAALGPSSPDTWHFMVEAKKLAYADLYAYNADPLFVEVPLDQLLAKSYARSRCQLIDMERSSVPAVKGGLDGGTVYLTAADRWGNMVSLVHSIFSVYGSGITIPPFGMILHNRGVAFSLDLEHSNVVAPRKRPFHTIMAGMLTQDGEPVMTFGNMGGPVQPETHAQHVVNVLDHGMNLQMTSDVARFTHNQNSNILYLENALFSQVGSALQARGHVVRAVNGSRVGGYQGILFTRDPDLPEPVFNQASIDRDHPVNGIYRAGSDHRKDGQAAGW